MADHDVAGRRPVPVPRGPRLGLRGTVLPRPRRAGPQLHARGWIRLRHTGLRPGVLRYQSARGTRDGPAAASGPRGVVGGRGTGRHRHGVPARHPDRCLRRYVLPGLRQHGVRPARGNRDLPRRRQHQQRRLRPRRLHLRFQRAGRHHRHRVLVLAGGPAHGLPVPAQGRVLDGPRGRRHPDVQPWRLHRVQPSARAVDEWTLQGVLRRRGRHRLG